MHKVEEEGKDEEEEEEEEKEEKEGSGEVNSNDLEDLDEIKSSRSCEGLVESKPLFQGLAKPSPEQSNLTSNRVRNGSNEVDNHNSNINPREEDKDGFTEVCSKKQKKKLKKLFKETSSQSRFDQEDTCLLNQVQFDTLKHLREQPQREIRKSVQFE